MKFYGELFTFILLFITNFRVFFVKQVKKDPLVSLAPISFFVSILQIVAWGFDLFTALAFIISFLVLISNFHAIFRYSENLYIDHYSPLMKFWAIFTTLLSVAAIVFNLMYYPVELNNNKLNIQENLILKTGSFRTGFEDTKPFEFSKVYITEFSLKPVAQKDDNKSSYLTNTYQHEETKKSEVKKVVLFVPDKRGDTQYYKPYLQALAKEGYIVYSADFFCDDVKWFHNIADFKPFRRFFLTLSSVLNNQKFESQREYYTYNISQEIKAFTSIISQLYNDDCELFIVTDGMGKTALADFMKSKPKNVIGTFALDSVPEFKTPGYGCVEQTDPFLAFVLGTQKDTELTAPKLLALKTKHEIQKLSDIPKLPEINLARDHFEEN